MEAGDLVVERADDAGFEDDDLGPIRLFTLRVASRLGNRRGRAATLPDLDAQRLAQEFIGDTIVANIVAMGYAWQRGLVPVGLAAMQRAIELNGVAVDANKAAFSLGRLAAADPAAASELLHEPAAASAAMRRSASSPFVVSKARLIAGQTLSLAIRLACTE